MGHTLDSTQRGTQLCCLICGNNSRFIQVMEHVENLVDGNLNHIHLLIGVPGHYHCRDCGADVFADDQH